jgi:hypothetical protein
MVTRCRQYGFLFVFFFGCALSFGEPTGTVMLKMPDGIELATDYYVPSEGAGPWPVLLIRTAYPKRIMERESGGWEREGIAGVVQDIRGLGLSQGAHNVFYTDGWREGARDGVETIRWIKSQPWCNGKIGTTGGSALGITQVMLAPATEDIVCQSIDVAPADFYSQVAFHGGVWRKNLGELWLTLLGHGDTITTFRSRANYDDFWIYYNAIPKASDVTAPAIHVGGWFDIFSQGTIDNFVSRQYNGGPGAKGNQKLIMRWATHNNNETPDYNLNENRRSLNLGDIRHQFQNHWLKGEQNDIMTQPAVYYYVMGDDKDPKAPGNEWRTANNWPPFATVETPYYLAFPGTLKTQPDDGDDALTYAYDPAHPMMTHGGNNLFLPAGPFDQRPANMDRADVLKFATPPLEAPMETTGQVHARLFVSTDAPDTDFTAKLVDIFPEGDEREINVLDGIRRVKFRNGQQAAPLLTSKDEVVELTIDLWSTSWVFNARHRIGIQISSSNYPRFDRNPNCGDDFCSETNMRVAHNTLHTGKKYASALLLPLRAQ